MTVKKILSELIAINSINPFSTIEVVGKQVGIGNESAINIYLERKLQEAGFIVTKQIVQEAHGNVPLRYNLLAEKGSGDKSLLFMGHSDTVEIKQGWTSNPLEATSKLVEGKERIFGLGANDMKGGIAAILAACQNNPQGYKLKVVFVVDEEFWSFGATKLLESHFLDDVKAVIVPEVGDAPISGEGQPIILGRMGRTEYEFKISGKSGHGAQARVNHSIINAVHESVILQKQIIKYCEDCVQEFRHGDIAISNSAYISKHDGGKAVLSVPESASFILDRSFVMGEDAESEIGKLKNIIRNLRGQGKLRAEVSVQERPRPTEPCQPYFTPPEHPFVKFVSNEVTSVYGGYSYGLGYSVADENRVAKLGLPVLVLGPLGDKCHAADEWVDVESLHKLTLTYQGIIERFGGLSWQ